MTPRSLAQRITEIHEALAAVPHAFGGALALAYYAEPRATIDIDLNVFVTVDRFEDVAGPLRDLGASVDDTVAQLVRRDGQARLMWDHTPLDVAEVLRWVGRTAGDTDPRYARIAALLAKR